MKTLDSIDFDFEICKRQFEEFRLLLETKAELSEQVDVLPFFRARRQLTSLFGTFNARISWADRIAEEFDIFGDFTCDLIVGERSQGEYCLVEFEDARSTSVFEKRPSKATTEWARRFDHGYSQIIDWIHKIEDNQRSHGMVSRFGQHEIKYEAVLVVGRDSSLSSGEKKRLAWRADNVLIGTKKVICMTFDGLLARFKNRLSIFEKVEAQAKSMSQSDSQGTGDSA